MAIAADFVKGHMGGNTILLVKGEQLDSGNLREQGVRAFSPERIKTDQVGILFPSGQTNSIRVRIICASIQNYISACGGLTQVLGKALGETSLASDLGVEITEGANHIELITDSGSQELAIKVENGRTVETRSQLNCFIDEIYELGVYPIRCGDVPAFVVGPYIAFNGVKIREVYPEADFSTFDQKTCRIMEKLKDEGAAFMCEKALEQGPGISLYDWEPENGGDLRVVFPHAPMKGHIEPACGTGSLSAAVAIYESGELRRRAEQQGNNRWELNLESGAGPWLGGPDRTRLWVEGNGSRLTGGSFTHSFVEITAWGKVSI